MKKKYHAHLNIPERQSFVPLIITTDGALGTEARILIKNVAKAISAKSAVPQSFVTGWLRARLSVAIVRATSMCIRAERGGARRVGQWGIGVTDPRQIRAVYMK
jgi:hypothetical protein